MQVAEPAIEDQLGDLVSASNLAPAEDSDRADSFRLPLRGPLQLQRVDRCPDGQLAPSRSNAYTALASARV